MVSPWRMAEILAEGGKSVDAEWRAWYVFGSPARFGVSERGESVVSGE